MSESTGDSTVFAEVSVSRCHSVEAWSGLWGGGVRATKPTPAHQVCLGVINGGVAKRLLAVLQLRRILHVKS